MPRKLRLLLADDDQNFHLIFRHAMTAAKAEACELEEVFDGTQAVDYVLGNPPYDDRQKYPPPDLVLLDQRMGSMDGSEALEKIKSDPRFLALPVGIMTSSSQPKLHELCYKNGAAFCVVKPMSFAALSLKIQTLVDFATTVLDLPRS
ncbi:MAG: response regulator [Candidatus Eisenbacteria bacterium]|uniref:Response regulator n=1 Tax=Eiseniibacteriota bacterium TaxID=2212470 RepID=A0A956LYH2_UNCEI|nr:response regulator [Candidatus Eisenbacteria bacterium]